MKEIAQAGLTFMDRVNLNGNEVHAWIQVNKLLGDLATGRTVISLGQRTPDLEAPPCQMSLQELFPDVPFE